MTVADERRQRHLHDRVGVRVDDVFRFDDRVARPRRRHDEALAQLGKQALRERADVEHARVAVQRLQCVERPRAVAELAVVVVFDDHGVVAARVVEQRAAPPERQRDPGGRLVRRRDGDDAHAGRQPLDDQSLIVDRRGDELRSGGRHREAKGRIAGVLDRDEAARRRDELQREQRERLLRAARDDDVVGVAGHRARERDVLRDRFAQLRNPVRGSVRESGAGLPPQGIRDEAPPDRVREVAVFRQSEPEAARRQHAGRREQPGRRAPRVAEPVPAIDRARGPRLFAAALRDLRDDRLRARAWQHVSLRDQQVIGGHRGIPPDAERARDPTRRGQLRAGDESSLEDRGAQLLVQIARDAASPARRQRQVERENWLHEISGNWHPNGASLSVAFRPCQITFPRRRT
jgi:hypothetical protein